MSSQERPTKILTIPSWLLSSIGSYVLMHTHSIHTNAHVHPVHHAPYTPHTPTLYVLHHFLRCEVHGGCLCGQWAYVGVWSLKVRHAEMEGSLAGTLHGGLNDPSRLTWQVGEILIPRPQCVLQFHTTLSTSGNIWCVDFLFILTFIIFACCIYPGLCWLCWA